MDENLEQQNNIGNDVLPQENNASFQNNETTAENTQSSVNNETMAGGTQNNVNSEQVNPQQFQQAPPPLNNPNTIPAYPTSPNGYYGNPYNPQGYAQPAPMYNTSENTTPKKENSKKGKSVFIILVVVCIALASLLIGTTLTKDKADTSGNKTEQSDDKNVKIDAAVPDVEESPYDVKEYSGNGAMTPVQIYESVKESNVGILVYYQNQQAGEGSGVIVGEDKSGTYTYIITCAHVIADSGVDIQVQFYDSSEYDAELVGIDSKTDIGVIRVKKTGFKAAKFGDSDSLKVGTNVYAIGNPGGTEFFGSFTDGIVSALDRPIATSTNGYYDLPCIQHTAAINPGNSGGALVNEFGQVIGINSSKIADTEYEDMGFAVPAEKVLEIYKELIANGYVSNRPMLGITYYAVSSDSTYSAIAWKNNLPYGSIVIASIATNSSLNDTNIKNGDIITAVNGKKLDDTAILLETIENAKVGDKLTLTVARLNNSGAVATTFDAEITLVEDKGNTVYKEEVTQQQAQDYYEAFPFNPFGY
ncbi:MAG: trypsin-like peptidase domain-containing protein [Clostridia bacterium]|nr:trypsin-like peptidase domain-containing protein [Clostridia bacterium]